MTSDQEKPSGMTLVFEASIPCRIAITDLTPNDAELARINESNETILRTLYALEEYLPEVVDDGTTVGQEMARLDFKVNMVLDLVSSLVQQFIKLPESLNLRVAADRLVWEDETSNFNGKMVRAELYLHPNYPRPVVFVGTAERLEQASNSTRLVYEHVAEPVQEWLEKLIFRHHRRSIAQAKA